MVFQYIVFCIELVYQSFFFGTLISSLGWLMVRASLFSRRQAGYWTQCWRGDYYSAYSMAPTHTTPPSVYTSAVPTAADFLHDVQQGSGTDVSLCW